MQATPSWGIGTLSRSPGFEYGMRCELMRAKKHSPVKQTNDEHERVACGAYRLRVDVAGLVLQPAALTKATPRIAS